MVMHTSVQQELDRRLPDYKDFEHYEEYKRFFKFLGDEKLLMTLAFSIADSETSHPWMQDVADDLEAQDVVQFMLDEITDPGLELEDLDYFLLDDSVAKIAEQQFSFIKEV